MPDDGLFGKLTQEEKKKIAEMALKAAREKQHAQAPPAPANEKRPNEKLLLFAALGGFFLAYLLETCLLPSVLSKGDPVYLAYWKAQMRVPLILTIIANLVFAALNWQIFAKIFAGKTKEKSDETKYHVKWNTGDKMLEMLGRINAVAWYVDDGRLELLPAEISDDKLTCKVPSKHATCTLYSTTNEDNKKEPIPNSRRLYYVDEDQENKVWPVVVIKSDTQTEIAVWIGMETGAFKPAEVSDITEGRAARSASNQKEDLSMAVSFGLILGYVGLIVGPLVKITTNTTAMLITTVVMMIGVLLTMALSKK